MTAARHSLLDRAYCDSEFSFKSIWKDEFKWCRQRVISTAKDFDVTFSSVLVKAAAQYGCIDINPDILGGTPRIAGTRIPVYMILDAIEHYGDLAGAMKSYPQLSLNQIKDAVCFSAQVLEHPVEY